ncbi:hypothetical protein ASE13_17305 [Sphingomonas sp. Root241]|nr:hypothetical protein ASE13_17305 [Sphingomonas sp. Root241]
MNVAGHKAVPREQSGDFVTQTRALVGRQRAGKRRYAKAEIRFADGHPRRGLRCTVCSGR